MSKLQYEFMLGIQKAIFNERLQRKPFLKIVEGTENMPLPLCYDSRTEEEVINCINKRIKKCKYNKILINDKG